MVIGNLKKMTTEFGDPVKYWLELSDTVVVNDYLGKKLTIRWSGIINCVKCSNVTKKSFGEGFCYNCFVSAPESAECIIRPELCRAHLGEGRDPAWEDRHHNQPHVVYLAASSAVKVGITRETQVPTRWIDQGASAAIIIARTPNRYEAGVVEVALKDLFTDKTHWQKMLKNDIDENIDLEEEKWQLEAQLPSDILEFFSDDSDVYEINYPVLSYPSTVKSLSFDKNPLVSGNLSGIKGQYLLFEDGSVFNIRKHTGYYVEIE